MLQAYISNDNQHLKRFVLLGNAVLSQGVAALATASRYTLDTQR